jgi:hypothetical protein
MGTPLIAHKPQEWLRFSWQFRSNIIIATGGPSQTPTVPSPAMPRLYRTPAARNPG